MNAGLGKSTDTFWGWRYGVAIPTMGNGGRRCTMGTSGPKEVYFDQLGLMDMGDLLELSKGLSKIGAKIFEGVWFKLWTSKSPFSFFDKHAPGF